MTMNKRITRTMLFPLPKSMREIPSVVESLAHESFLPLVSTFIPSVDGAGAIMMIFGNVANVDARPQPSVDEDADAEIAHATTAVTPLSPGNGSHDPQDLPTPEIITDTQ